MKFLSEKNLDSVSVNNMIKKYQALFKNVLKFEGLEYGVQNYLMEKLLINGKIAAFNLEAPKVLEYKELAFATYVERKWRWDDNPASISVLNERGASYFPTRELIVNEEAVIIKLDFIPNNFIKEYVQRLFDIQKTIDTNLKVHKMPFIIQSTDNKTISAIRDILKNNFVVAVDDLTFNVLETQAPYIIDKLQLYKSEVEAELLTILGVDNVKFEKKAQMTKDEINSNNEEITAYRKIIKDKIEAFFNQINDVLGWNLSIEEDEKDEILEEEKESEDDENA